MAMKDMRWLTVASWACLVFGVIANIVALWMPVCRDAGGFLAFGARIAQGAEFYRDLFDRKAPLLFYELGALFRIVGPSLWWARIFMLAHTAVTALILWAISRRLGWSNRWKVVLIAAFLVLVPAFLGFEVLTEVPVMLAGTLVIWMLVAEAPSSRLLRSFLVGVLIGVATTWKQVGILLVPAVVIWWLVDDRHGRRALGSSLGNLTLMGIGVLLPLAVLSLYFWAIGSFDEMVYAVWTSNLYHYPGFPFRAWLYELARDEVARALVLWVPVAVAAPVAAWRFVQFGQRRVEALLLLVVLFSWAPSIKRPYEHYVIAFLPHLVLLGVSIWRGWTTAYRLRWLIALAAFTLIPTVRHYVLYTVPPLAERLLARQLATAEQIRSYLEPGEPLYVLGSEPKYYFLTGHYSDDPVYFILPENAYMRPPDKIRQILATPGLRYVVVAQGVLDPVQQVADEVRARSHEVFCEQIGRLERVCLYRLPEDK